MATNIRDDFFERQTPEKRQSVIMKPEFESRLIWWNIITFEAS